MPTQGHIDPHHAGPRRFFRVAGPVVLATGGVLILIGFVAVGCTMRGHRVDDFTFFLGFFLGMPLTFAGAVMTQFGYMGRMARYVAEETTPVATDTFNYAARATKESVRELAKAVGEGLRGTGPTAATELPCPRCLHKNDPDARFCSACGSPLATTRECPGCRHENDIDARFCDNCGQALGA